MFNKSSGDRIAHHFPHTGGLLRGQEGPGGNQNRSTLKLPFELRGGILLSATSFLTLALAFPVQILVARYLGPELFGSYAFALSFANLARAICALGLQDVLVPLYKKERDDAWFGSGLLLKKVVAICLTLATALWVASDSAGESSLGVAIVVAAYLFSDHEIYTIWCRCEGRLKDYVMVDFGGTLVGLALRLWLIFNEGSVFWLLISYVLEQVAKLVLALGIYLLRGRPMLRPFRASRHHARRLLKESWPIWLVSLLTVGYGRLDQILLGTLLADTSELGQYSVAARIVEAMSAVGVALFIVYLPLLSQSQAKQDEEAFQVHLQRFHDLGFGFCFISGGLVALVLQPLIITLYGSKFQTAADLGILLLLLLPPTYLGLCRAAFLYARGRQKVELHLKSLQLLANLVLNLILIPHHGAVGAVVATLSVQWGILLTSYLLVREFRPLAGCALKALWLPSSFGRVLRWVRNR